MDNSIERQWQIKSHNSSKTYTVTQYADGTWRCGCPHNIFRRAECKHIKEAMQRLVIEDRVNSMEEVQRERRIAERESQIRAAEEFADNLPKKIWSNLYPIAQSHIEFTKVDKEKKITLVPVIPYDETATSILATIVFDLHQFGYSWKSIKKYYKHMIPSDWTWKGVRTFIESNGRTAMAPQKLPKVSQLRQSGKKSKKPDKLFKREIR